ncbi:hypothetical protein CGH44_20500, partial [Vibrio parahaemolyticus]
ALRGEQRDATQLKLLCHKHKSLTLNQNCQALRIPLKRFVMCVLDGNALPYPHCHLCSYRDIHHHSFR